MPDVHVRLDHLEKDMDGVCTDVHAIMTNHLPHIQEELAALKTQLKIYGGLIIAGITALIVLGLTP